jgi:hypothetical protein
MLFLQWVIVFLLFSLPFGSLILYPIHIAGVLFHELGHALVAWMTGARVLSIKIGPNVDGLTEFQGGSFCMICPAGYLGAAIAGGAMIFCSFSQRASFYMAWVLMGSFAVAAFHAADLFSFFVPMAMIASLGLYLQLGARKKDKYLRWIISMTGVTASTFSIWDIVNDLVFRNVPKSDAYQFSTHCVYSPAILVGIVWCIIAVILIWFFLVLGMRAFPRVTSE